MRARLAIALLLLCGPAWAQDKPPQANPNPPQAEQVFAPTPPGFALTDSKVDDKQRVFEFLPQGQTAQSWTERIGIVVFFGMKGRNPKQAAEALQSEWRASCPAFSSNAPEQRLEKNYPASILTMACSYPEPPQGRMHREFVMAKIMQGADSLYLVQRAWRGGPEYAPLPLTDKATGDAWAKFFNQVEVCDTRLRGQPCAALGKP